MIIKGFEIGVAAFCAVLSFAACCGVIIAAVAGIGELVKRLRKEGGAPEKWEDYGDL